MDSLEIKTTFADRYRVLQLLGDGGMGKVYLAEDLVLEGEKVALKILRLDLCNDDKHVKRFIREVQLTRKVAHPNVVRTFDIAWNEGSIYFTMEYVEGITLKDRLERGSLPVREALQVLLEISRGLSVIHDNEIIHRDLKPGNIILSKSGIAKIADFGIARPSFSDLTNQNEVVGSAGYMAPEVWTGGTLDIRSDIYALGVMAYETITGLLPFDGTSATEVMNKHLGYVPPKLGKTHKDTPEWLSDLIFRMVEKDPNKRPSSTAEIISIIETGLKQKDVAPTGQTISISPSDTRDFPPPTVTEKPLHDSTKQKYSAKKSFAKTTESRNRPLESNLDIKRFKEKEAKVSENSLFVRKYTSYFILFSFAYVCLVSIFPMFLEAFTPSVAGASQSARIYILSTLAVFFLGMYLSSPLLIIHREEAILDKLLLWVEGCLLISLFLVGVIMLLASQGFSPLMLASAAYLAIIRTVEVSFLDFNVVPFFVGQFEKGPAFTELSTANTFSLVQSILIFAYMSLIVFWMGKTNAKNVINLSLALLILGVIGRFGGAAIGLIVPNITLFSLAPSFLTVSTHSIFFLALGILSIKYITKEEEK